MKARNSPLTAIHFFPPSPPPPKKSQVEQNAPSAETKEWNIEKEVIDLLEDPNRRPLAWKLNQFGRKGRRK